MFEINGHTKQLGIIGYPVEHTFSPNMHNFISETVHNNYVYGAWCVKPEDLKDAIGGMRALGISGINVTAPHKVEVMKDIDVVTDGAKKLGSVNTVVNRDGKLYGYNTDADGFCMALTKAGIEIENSRILIIGAGGLGAPAAMYLAAAGVGTIGIADADEVDLSNLQRQIIHQTADVGKAKVQSAKETMNAMNPDVTVNTYREFITSENIMDIIKDYDFVIDGTDNFPAKFLINDACVMAKKPFSHAGIIRFKGQLMTYVPGEGPCYRCVFKNPPPKDAVPTCKQAGVIGAMGGVIGSLQAMEAIKYILGVGDLLTGYLLTYDAITQEFHKIKLPSNTDGCAVCGKHPTITELIDYEQVVCEDH